MARRRIPVHESLEKPPPGILEALAERLGVPETAAEPPPEDTSAEDSIEPQLREDVSHTSEQKSVYNFRISVDTSSIDIDPRIVEARRRQALYVRLPQEMHEYLQDLSHALSKTNRDASMTNLVAQAILEKFPDALGWKETTEQT